jgi:SAM-dependent methyltransferase
MGEGPAAGVSEQAVFLQAWQTYRKVLDRNYMFHREVYSVLRQVLLATAPGYRFLDIACGDAAATVTALRGTEVGAYYGIDISEPALEIAGRELADLDCTVRLIAQDLGEALAGWSEPVDVAWIGQSLHHLGTEAKRELMRAVRRNLRPGGLFLIWEPTTERGEDRDGWTARFVSGSRSLWSDLDDAEWNAMLAHIRAADYPEPAEIWLRLGREAGFARTNEVYTAPTGLARVYRFQD